jgi:DNA-binding MarR family transcriptional regulator
VKASTLGGDGLGALVARFLAEMHRYDAGRTLPILLAARLTTPQLAALEFVREPRTVSAVAVHLGLSRPATSQLIDKLARKGLVRRTEGTIDRRERNVVLSAKGKSLVGRIAAARAARFDASLAVLSRPGATRLATALAAVVDELEQRHPRSHQVLPDPSRSSWQ